MLLTKLATKLTASLSTETMKDRRYWSNDLKCWEKYLII